MSEKEPQGSFLNRWSSRKREAAAQVAAVEEYPSVDSSPLPLPNGPESEPIMLTESTVSSDSDEHTQAIDNSTALQSEEADLEPEELLLSDADMPPIETLTAESDVSAFFNKGVSAALRKAALRYVFQQPRFNVRDGLNDYDGDYTVFEPLGDTITSDMKFHAARKERNRLEAEAEAQREEELLRQQQVDETESAEKADVDDKDTSDEKSPADEAPSSEPDVEGDFETDSETELPALAHADGEGELNQQAKVTAEKVERV